MRTLHLVLAFAVGAHSVGAQTPAIPPAITQYIASTTATSTRFVPPLFPPLSLASTTTAPRVSQIELRKLVSGSEILYRLAATRSGVLAVYGGSGRYDVLEAIYDASSQNAVMTNLAASFNTKANEYDFSISEDGLTGVCRVGTTTAKWARRTGPAGLFPQTATVTGLPTGIRDTKLFTDGNQLRLAWTEKLNATSSAIFAGDFNAGAVTNVKLLISPSLVTASTTIVRTPHPVTQEIPPGSGNWVVLGWLFAAPDGGPRRGLDMDTYWLPMHDGTVPTSSPPVPLVVHDNLGQQLGSTTLGASGSAYTTWFPNLAPQSLSMVAMNGATFSASAGGTAHLRVMVPWSQTDVWNTIVVFGTAMSPISLPFANGNPLGQTPPAAPGQIGVSPIVSLSQPVDPRAPGGVTFSLSIPPSVVPAGIPISMQAIGINFSTGKAYTGNTAILEGL